jgi:multiple sugar transport system permease protein
MAILVSIIPFIWILLTSFKTPTDVFQYPPRWIFQPTLDNYRVIFFGKGMNFSLAFENSAVVTGASTAISVALGSLASYSLARLPLPGKRPFSYFVLFTRMLPTIALMIPLYILLTQARLFDTRLGLIIVYTAFNIPLVIWLLRGFFADFPLELEECAMIDGASRFGAFLRITLPATAPGLAAAAVFSAFWIWNDFILAFLFTQDKAVTLIVLASRFMEEEGVKWGQVGAASVIAVLPIFLFSILIQGYLTHGLLAGSIKG